MGKKYVFRFPSRKYFDRFSHSRNEKVDFHVHAKFSNSRIHATFFKFSRIHASEKAHSRIHANRWGARLRFVSFLFEPISFYCSVAIADSKLLFSWVCQHGLDRHFEFFFSMSVLGDLMTPTESTILPFFVKSGTHVEIFLYRQCRPSLSAKNI